MTTDRHLERDLPDILGEIATGRYPDYIDDVLATTAQRRQRPGWTFPERWLPVEIAEPRARVARLPRRQIGVLALIAVLLAVLLAVYVGSLPQQRLPPPFGVAANGLVAYVQDGDIYTADPVTGAAKAIVTGPETDLHPVWSLDGTRFVFERKDKGAGGLLYVANHDGRGLAKVTPDPLFELTEYSFSPDGRSIVSFALGEQGPAIMVIPSDGTGQPTFFYVGQTSHDGAATYRPDGSEIMFIGKKLGAAYRDVYALDPVSGKVRMIIAGRVSADIHSSAWSPDGTRIAYSDFDQNADGVSSRTHVVNADGSGDITVDTHPDSIAAGGTTWSNDSKRLIITRFFAADPDGLGRSVVVPIDRSSVGVDLECPPNAPMNDCTADWQWSPDDSVLLGVGDPGESAVLADPATGKIRQAPWPATTPLTWQRVAR